MLIAPAASMVVAAASSALILTVASQCARNMIQTVRIMSEASNNGRLELPWHETLVQTLETASDQNELSQCLQGMNRTQLLRVFSAFGRVPQPEELEELLCSSDSEWEGTLLDNNSKIMDLSSTIMTNAFFGGRALPWVRKKGLWAGKNFKKYEATTGGTIGVNRFATISNKKDDDDDDDDSNSSFERHAFDYSVENSKVDADRSKCIRCVYSNYQSLPISLWHSMVDEIRVIDVPNRSNENKNDVILIGMGYMGWSGGALNCAPFMLEKRSR